jgi:glycosyltransferase involved in cell wall biosynthesis
MNNPIRVLHVIPSLSRLRGGPSEAIVPMVRALNKRGLCARIATTNDDGEEIRKVPLNEWTQEEGVAVRFFPRFSPRVRAVREYAYSRPFSSWLRKNLGAYDIVHVHALFSFLSSATMRLARQLQFPYVIRPAGSLGCWPLRQSAWRKRIYLACGETARLGDADAVHFTSETERCEAERFSPFPRGIVIPHGITAPGILPRAKVELRAKLGLSIDQKLVLFMGRIHAKKGIDLLLASLEGVPDPSMTLLLAGDGPPSYITGLKRLVQEYRLEKRVIWLGHVVGEKKRLLLQGADLFVLVSHHENFGLAVLESLAAGTPVLISEQVALAAEVKLHRLGRIVPLQIDAVREALREMISEDFVIKGPELRSWVASHYSWERNADALSELYASILTSRLPQK